MAKPLSDVRALIREAKDLRLQFSTILNTLKAYDIVAEPFGTKGLYRHVFRVIATDDEKLKIKGKQLFDALRSALDFLNVECARLNGSSSSRGMYFPFEGDREKLHETIPKKCKCVPKIIQDYFVSLQPYQGGDEQLFELNQIRNRQSHAQLSNFVRTATAIQIVAMDSIGQSKIIEIPSGTTQIEIMVTEEQTIRYGVSMLTGLGFEGTNFISAYGLDALITKVENIVDHTQTLLSDLGLIHDMP